MSETEKEDGKKLAYSDADLLRMVGEERKRSIGFGDGNSGALTTERERNLAYYKGEMDDVPAPKGRSSVVDRSVLEAVETVFPDLMEVLTGGEDVATFIPQGAEDEQKAKDETEVVKHVVFQENEGFLAVASAVKDSLITKTGIIHWWFEEEETFEVESEVPEEMAPLAQAIAEISGQMLEAQDPEAGKVSLGNKKLHGKVKIMAVPSEDFSVSPDTVSLRDTTYCCMRSRPRVQDLIARGVDPEIARSLPLYTIRNGSVEQERDTAEEYNQADDNSPDDLRMVETRKHYLRIDLDGDGKLELWEITTDAEEKTFIEKEQVNVIPFAAGTPYLVPHRFHGLSVADLLIEVQKIKTVLLRSHLDSIYFALNQRMEVAETQASEFTISDLLRNEPGSPIRVKTPGAVRPISSGTMGEVLPSLEYASTMAESRSGVVRNAQGLNPDTLHDTAAGARVLIGAAQKRVRMIARMFAETLIKDLFLGVHGALREYMSEEHEPIQAKIGGQWQSAMPAEWPARCNLAIEVGIGSAGRDHDIMVANQRIALMERLAAAQGGLSGPLLDADNAHSALVAWERAVGSKAPERFWSDPKKQEPQPPQPDPDVVKVEKQMQLEGQKAQSQAVIQAGKVEADSAAAIRKAELDYELALKRLDAEMTLKRYQVDQELALKERQLAEEFRLKQQGQMIDAMTGANVPTGSTSEVYPGGEPG